MSHDKPGRRDGECLPPTPIDSYIGFRLQQRRRDLGITPEELSKLLKISVSALSDYESGRRCISASVLHAAAVMLEVPMGWFYDGHWLQNATDNSVNHAFQREHEALMSHYIGVMKPEQRVQLLAIARLLADNKN